jgi:hypothetical protein
VRALMRSRRHRGLGVPGGPALAYITAFPTRDGWRNLGTPVFAQMFAGAQARAEQSGYRLEEFWFNAPGMTPRRFEDVLRARGIHGLIVAPLPDANASIDIAWGDFAAVALGTTLVRPPLHRVANDLFHSMLIAMEECHRLGYRRIGLALRSAVNQKVQRRWLAAYLLAQSELAGLKPVRPLLAESLVSLSAPRMGDPMSGIYQNAEQIGMRSVDLLMTLLERNEFGVPVLPDALLVDGQWNEGRTVAARRRR